MVVKRPIISYNIPGVQEVKRREAAPEVAHGNVLAFVDALFGDMETAKPLTNCPAVRAKRIARDSPSTTVPWAQQVAGMARHVFVLWKCIPARKVKRQTGAVYIVQTLSRRVYL